MQGLRIHDHARHPAQQAGGSAGFFGFFGLVRWGLRCVQSHRRHGFADQVLCELVTDRDRIAGGRAMRLPCERRSSAPGKGRVQALSWVPRLPRGRPRPSARCGRSGSMKRAASTSTMPEVRASAWCQSSIVITSRSIQLGRPAAQQLRVFIHQHRNLSGIGPAQLLQRRCQCDDGL